MKNCLKNLTVALALVGVVGMLPTMVGCNKRPDPRANPDFNEDMLDPSKVKMAPIGGPGDAAKEAKQ